MWPPDVFFGLEANTTSGQDVNWEPFDDITQKTSPGGLFKLTHKIKCSQSLITWSLFWEFPLQHDDEIKLFSPPVLIIMFGLNLSIFHSFFFQFGPDCFPSGSDLRSQALVFYEDLKHIFTFCFCSLNEGHFSCCLSVFWDDVYDLFLYLEIFCVALFICICF